MDIRLRKWILISEMICIHLLVILVDTSDWIKFVGRMILISLESDLICSLNRMNDSCQWNFFGWKMYSACGYRQKINER